MDAELTQEWAGKEKTKTSVVLTVACHGGTTVHIHHALALLRQGFHVSFA